MPKGTIPSAARRKYTAKRGDDFLSIAQRFFGSTVPEVLVRLLEANKDVAQVSPGMILNIPGVLPTDPYSQTTPRLPTRTRPRPLPTPTTPTPAPATPRPRPLPTPPRISTRPQPQTQPPRRTYQYNDYGNQFNDWQAYSAANRARQAAPAPRAQRYPDMVQSYNTSSPLLRPINPATAQSYYNYNASPPPVAAAAAAQARGRPQTRPRPAPPLTPAQTGAATLPPIIAGARPAYGGWRAPVTRETATYATYNPNYPELAAYGVKTYDPDVALAAGELPLYFTQYDLDRGAVTIDQLIAAGYVQNPDGVWVLPWWEDTGLVEGGTGGGGRSGGYGRGYGGYGRGGYSSPGYSYSDTGRQYYANNFGVISWRI